MQFLLALLVWLLMAAVLTAGMVLAVKGSYAVLIIGVLAFIIGMGKIGCLSH